MTDMNLNEKIVETIRKIEFFESHQIFPIIFSSSAVGEHDPYYVGWCCSPNGQYCPDYTRQTTSIELAMDSALQCCSEVFNREYSTSPKFNEYSLKISHVNIFHIVKSFLYLQQYEIYITIYKFNTLAPYTGFISYYSKGNPIARCQLKNSDKWQLLSNLILLGEEALNYKNPIKEFQEPWQIVL